MTTIKTNERALVAQSVCGVVHHPVVRLTDTRISCDGTPFALPNVGGICYNVTLGDSVYGLEGDHIEPDVSLFNFTPQENFALNFLACIGNVAEVKTGDAKGAKGFVTGKHGGIEHLIVWFDEEAKEKMTVGDLVQIKAVGQGLKLTEFPHITVKNLAPELTDKLIRVRAGKPTVAVCGEVPAHLMGSGIGFVSSYTGDYDIMTADRGEIAAHKLNRLRFGDVVALYDCDTLYGRGFQRGALTIGIVVHSDCKTNGHGPGVVTVLNCRREDVRVEIDRTANLKNFLSLH